MYLHILHIIIPNPVYYNLIEILIKNNIQKWHSKLRTSKFIINYYAHMSYFHSPTGITF